MANIYSHLLIEDIYENHTYYLCNIVGYTLDNVY